MKSKSRDDEAFKAKCWDAVKTHFHALGKEHMIDVIERGVELNEQKDTDTNELDT